MFRARDPQESLWQSEFLVTPKKAKLMQRSWAEVFRNKALPLIDPHKVVDDLVARSHNPVK